MAKKKQIKPSKRVLAKKAEKQASTHIPEGKKLVLHVGCVNDELHAGLDDRFIGDEWHEVRLGFEPEAKTSNLLDLRDLSAFKVNQFDAIWFPGKLDRFNEAEALAVCKQFRRVLKDEGTLLLNVPNIKKVCEQVYKRGIKHAFHRLGDHDITPLDLLFGFQPDVMRGVESAKHNIGFTPNALVSLLKTAGFKDCKVQVDGLRLWGRALKLQQDDPSNPRGKVIGDDPNEMMRVRDELDVPPALAVSYKI